jgi:hypothetical protein
MKRLKHPIRSIREPFGKAGLTVAILALVLAMVGGAYAAGGLTKSQEKQVKKIAKKYAGKPGAPGATGAPGSPGANGKDGSNGAPGAAGKSVATSNATVGTGAECPTGTTGTKFQVEGSATASHVCNGKNGATGFTETLPPGQTETGVWVAGPAREFQAPIVPISYSIPLAEPSQEVVFLNLPETEASSGSGACEYETEEPEATPVAPPGTLCVFSTEEGFGEFKFIGMSPAELGDTPTGTFIWLKAAAEGEFPGMRGVWAVTAPTAP